jgi:Delta7-sterol 5-desaturase
MDWSKFFRELLNIADKYYVIAGAAFLAYYVLLKKRITWKKIQLKFPGKKDYRREILYSTVAILIFSIPPLFLLQNDYLRPYTTFYTDISRHGWLYFWGAFPLMLLMHDTYFYWMHRLIHHPRLFRLIHLVHHRSVNPSPWAAYAFHPLEAFLESLIFVIFLFTIPINGWHLFIFFVISLLYNVYGHLGFELYPAGFQRHWLGKWMNTSVCHNLHHHYFKGNYGLYFLFWDRMMGTLRPDYHAAYEEVTMREKEMGDARTTLEKETTNESLTYEI